MAKIQGLIETCNECNHCKIFEEKGARGGPYAAICIEADILLRVEVSFVPSEAKIPIPAKCPLPNNKQHENTNHHLQL